MTCMEERVVVVPSGPWQNTQGNHDMEATPADPVVFPERSSRVHSSHSEWGRSTSTTGICSGPEWPVPGTSSAPQEPPQEAAWVAALQPASTAAQELGKAQ